MPDLLMIKDPLDVVPEADHARFPRCWKGGNPGALL